MPSFRESPATIQAQSQASPFRIPAPIIASLSRRHRSAIPALSHCHAITSRTISHSWLDVRLPPRHSVHLAEKATMPPAFTVDSLLQISHPITKSPRIELSTNSSSEMPDKCAKCPIHR